MRIVYKQFAGGKHYLVQTDDNGNNPVGWKGFDTDQDVGNDRCTIFIEISYDEKIVDIQQDVLKALQLIESQLKSKAKCYFAYVDDETDDLYSFFLISPQDFWNEHKCCPDHHIAKEIDLPPTSAFCEIQASVFEFGPLNSLLMLPIDPGMCHDIVKDMVDFAKKVLVYLGHIENKELLP